MYLFIESDDLLQKYNTFCDKFSVDIKKELYSKPVYYKKFLKIEIKSHSDEVTDFYDNKISKVVSNPTCLAVISLHSALERDENYYSQLFLKECKYIEERVIRHISDNLSDFSSSNESDKE